MSSLVAIDQSTSATKAILFDEAGCILDKTTREHRQIYPQPGWVEHDAEEIWQNVLCLLEDLSDRQPMLLANAAGISITNQRETILVFERITGKPLTNAIVWQCRRSDPICAELRDAGHEEMVRRKTGLKLDAYFSGSKLKWLAREKPDILQKLRSGDALIGTIDTYLLYRLTGGAVFATDHTNASRTLLYNIDQCRWDADLCELFDVPPEALPEIHESFAVFGHSDAAGRLPEKLPISGVIGDSQASLFAQRCYEPGMAKATFGSGTSVLLNAGNRLPSSSHGAVAALAWVWKNQPTYALEGLINYSSATIAWLKDRLGLIDDAASTGSIAATAQDNGGVYFVPAFSGLSAPYWSPEARAAIMGMTAYTRKEHIVRAALESISYQIRDVLEMIQADDIARFKVLFCDGGPTQNGFLMQFTADITGLDLVVADVPESSALGAAMAGMLGLGIHHSLADLTNLPRATETYHPQMDAADVNRYCLGWKKALERVL
ncbi:MAG: glycerol kinase GlpK [Pirellulales bacterium]|nr:glycerol kinase GlpK [Pirellulales bacterium]